MKTTLIIMAAGLGSRFGKGIKQLAPVGPCGEMLMEYSVYDAKKAGFDRVVIVLRRDLLPAFRRRIGKRIENMIETEYAFQELGDLPEGFSLPQDRMKPWGTGQAVLACRKLIDGPFAVINADDYYGRDAYVQLYRYLTGPRFSGFKAGNVQADSMLRIGMAAFQLKNTVSSSGSVNRGICRTDGCGHLTSIRETGGIRPDGKGGICAPSEENPEVMKSISPDTCVSMNMWAFGPEFMDVLEEGFRAFLSNASGKDSQAEYLLPILIGQLLDEGRASVDVMESHDRWIGLTYQEDVPDAQAALLEMTMRGEYPYGLRAPGKLDHWLHRDSSTAGEIHTIARWVKHQSVRLASA
ncbi:MAG: NDP-sugar synthase, partial [Eubacterium sp.]